MFNSLSDIRDVHLELSSRCNASCPLCPRNFYGYPFNDGYVERDMSLNEIKKIFSYDFVNQLTSIRINGNFGDAIMNTETIDIIRYFRDCSSNLYIHMTTNASGRNKDFWESLAKLNVVVCFCIDSIGESHSIYRKGTRYSTIIKNAKTFIAASGIAVWKAIKFAHNESEIETMKKLSEDLGFTHFALVDDGRDTAPVFDKNKKLVNVIGTPEEIDFATLWERRTTSEVLLEDIIHHREILPITCESKEKRSIFISSTGEVYPCCFLGFSPKTYGKGTYHQAANAQFKHLVVNNNAMEYDLEECIKWFSSIPDNWNKNSYEEGRFMICNTECGNCSAKI